MLPPVANVKNPYFGLQSDLDLKHSLALDASRGEFSIRLARFARAIG